MKPLYALAGLAMAAVLTPALRANNPPVGYLDSVSPSTVSAGQAINGNGWAADYEMGAPVDHVDILVDGSVICQATLGDSRPDVQNANSNGSISPLNVTNSGYHFSVNSGSLSVGTHTFSAIAYDNQGASGQLGNTFSITVNPSTPPTVVINGVPSSAADGTTINPSTTATEGSSPMTTLILSYSWDNTNWTQLAATPYPSNPTDTHGNPLTLNQAGVLHFKSEVWDAEGNDVVVTASMVSYLFNWGSTPTSVASGTTYNVSVTLNDGGGFPYVTLYKNGGYFAGGWYGTQGNTTDTGNTTVQYTADYSDSNNGTSGSGSMNVSIYMVAPSITGQPSSQTVNQGSSASFSVSASGSPTLNYQWQFNGGNISGATNSTYSISSAQPSDAGTYACVVSNSAGSVTSSGATLTVQTAPVFTSQPQGQTVNVGATVTFTASATGNPSPTYQWRFNGSPISGATQSSYTITNAQTSDTGNYDVQAINPAGTTDSSTATLTVNAPLPPAPVITSAASATGTANSTFSYTITASNSPSGYGANGLPSGLSVNGSTGVISGTPATAGTYSVTIAASNAGGTGSATLTINVGGATSAPLPLDLNVHRPVN